MRSNVSQSGSILIYAMLIMASMLAIGLTLGSLFIGKLKSASAVRDSITALYVADSAAELCLYEARQGAPAPSPRMEFAGTVLFEIKSTEPGNPDVTGDCSVLGSSSFGFRATGTYRGVRRTLEISQ